MCDIISQNFYIKYDEILKDISESDFIAFDCEFSGLTRHEEYKQSLFDDPAENYSKFCKGNEDFIAFQIGITSFRYNPDGKYEATTYTFHLLPRIYSGWDPYFLCDAYCIQFLARQNFDFNKVFRYGITYARASEEAAIKKKIKDGSLVWKMRRELNKLDRKVLLSLCCQVKEWSFVAETGDTTVVDVTGIDPFTLYLIREEIEWRCPHVRTYQHDSDGLRVEMTDGPRVRHCDEEVFVLASGFTRLLKEVIAMKKPVIGHNFFSDLLVIYKMFIAPPPDTYETFKSEINRLFPEVYDTKYLSAEVKKFVGKKNTWTLNALENLYMHFNTGTGKSIVEGMPVIEYKSSCEAPRIESCHNSGFDSYCTGYVFLKLAHMLTMWDPVENAFRSISLGNDPPLYFGAVRDMRNRINVTRSYADYVCLDGPDPDIVKPDFLLMESLSGAIDIAKVSNLISKYDTADIKPLTRRCAIIAPSNSVSYKTLRKQLMKGRNYRLSKYQPDMSQNTATLKKGTIALTLVGGIGIAAFLWYKKVGGVEKLKL